MTCPSPPGCGHRSAKLQAESGVDVAGLSLFALEWCWSFSRAKIISGGWGLATVAQRPEGRGWQCLKVPNS